jgi:raffinose/stachyose/melibiose transport system permease protein/N-acetylglucosamine transport system permease protein
MIVFVGLIIYTISFLTPLAWSIITSFKSNFDYNMNLFGFPKEFAIYNGEEHMFGNYLVAWDNIYVKKAMDVGGYLLNVEIHMWELLGNSLLYAVVATIITTFSHAIAAYLAARYSQFRLMRWLYPIVIFTMLLPIVGNLASSIKVMRDIGFYDNLIGLWIAKGSFLGSHFLIFYAAFKGISWEYAEAAFIDGASHAKVLFEIMLPLAMGTMSAIFVLNFIGFWNDWNINVVYLPSFPMLAYALYTYQETVVGDAAKPPAQTAGCMLVAFPMFVMFIIFRKKLMGNLTIGGIKG